MLILPLDHPEPFAATLGVMLYPSVDEEDKARAFATQWLAKPVRRLRDAGLQLSPDQLERLVMDCGVLLTDVEDRWKGGLATGELFRTFFILAKNNRTLASWENAIEVYVICAQRTRSTGSRAWLNRQKTRFLSVAHLWAAWCIREGKFSEYPELGYDGWTDLQYFLAEAEILRDFGQVWRPSRAKAGPPLPPDVWRVPLDWQPPPRQPGWPNTGMIPDLALTDGPTSKIRLNPVHSSADRFFSRERQIIFQNERPLRGRLGHA